MIIITFFNDVALTFGDRFTTKASYMEPNQMNGDRSTQANQTPAMPRIGDTAPDFGATTTKGEIRFSDFAEGSWTILFSHPADFTPVCTTELSRFKQEEEDFKALNTQLIGLSVDSIHSHLAWVHNVKEKNGIYMDFPIIADIDMRVSQLFGMIHPGENNTEAVRAMFFIDPNRKIRLIHYYPLSVGRNTHEMKRVLKALQTADEQKVATPINWEAGDKGIVPAPKTLEDVEDRDQSDQEKVDFYLVKQEL